MKILIYINLFILVSCATPYQKQGFRGGYSESQVNRDLYEVVFDGNGYTKQSTVYEYLKRRCAEITLEKGYSHYVILSGKDETSGYIQTINGETSSVEKPSNRVLIKLLKDPSPDVIAYDANMVLGNKAPSKLPSWND